MPLNLQRLLAQIRSAKKSLDICVFLITSHHLAEEVIARIKKGVTVRIILDDSSGASSISKKKASRKLSCDLAVHCSILSHLIINP